MIPTVAWIGGVDGHLELLDQTRLPATQTVLRLTDLDGVVDAIRRLAVRGAPAIGVAAGYGMVVGVAARRPADAEAMRRAAEEVGEILDRSRPTAVNLTWATARIRARVAAEPTLDAMLDEARAIHAEDAALCRAMGEHGAALLPHGARVLTHCNTGRLATGGTGTALAVVFEAHRRGNPLRVLADETRPLLQGARLTAFELVEAGIPVDVVADGAAPALIARGEVDVVLTGADRIAANGDAANKIGTYALALACAAHGVPFYVVAPATTFDLALPSGAAIPIEERDPDEVLSVHGVRIAAAGAGARNPAFDVTPASLISALVTDRGVIRPVLPESIKATLG